jgi:ABC-type multidrug transport system fused ATPase/permease subunit
MPALQQIYGSLANIKFHIPLLDMLVDELQETDLLNLSKNDLSAVDFHTKIQLKSISFQYANADLPTIDKLNMEIIPNTTIGIVGSTGSGKTTLVDIILGLLPIESGEMVADKVSINSSNIHNWQKNFGYVPQTIYLTDNTIAHNIAFSVSDQMINLNNVVEAAKLAELDEFVQTLPQKYNTYVGERGVRLSGGQRQRIGIARSLYNNPKILVLDEATSSLDGITENVVMDAIHNLAHKKTIIIIAHRLTTVEECDVIHMIDSGKITASGTYEELIGSNEQFRKMANV